jgi:hypothetical protein
LRQLASFQLLLQELSLSAEGRLHILVVGDRQWRLNRVVVARDGRNWVKVLLGQSVEVVVLVLLLSGKSLVLVSLLIQNIMLVAEVIHLSGFDIHSVMLGRRMIIKVRIHLLLLRC